MDHSIPDSMICCVRTPHPSLVAAWLTAPMLRGRALILGGLAHERASVTTASAEARAQSVVEGMSLNQAQQFAPDAIFQAVDEEATARVRQSLLLTLHHFTPDVAAGEDPGCAFLRLDRLALRWPDRAQLLTAISRAIDAAIRVSPAIGVASSMFVSAVAAAHATAPVPLVVEHEQTRAFLARYRSMFSRSMMTCANTSSFWGSRASAVYRRSLAPPFAASSASRPSRCMTWPLAMTGAGYDPLDRPSESRKASPSSHRSTTPRHCNSSPARWLNASAHRCSLKVWAPGRSGSGSTRSRRRRLRSRRALPTR